jgi:hypothetical protein
MVDYHHGVSNESVVMFFLEATGVSNLLHPSDVFSGLKLEDIGEIL